MGASRHRGLYDGRYGRRQCGGNRLANALYILTGTEDSAIILDESSDVPDISSQLVYVTSGSSGHDVTLTAGQTVTVHHDGAVISVQSKEETISALLDRLHIQPVLWTWWVWT